MMLLIEDLNQNPTACSISIDYLAINVTVSPFSDDWLNLSNSTDGVLIAGANLTRNQLVNVSAHWNASSMSVVEGMVLFNNTLDSVGQQQYNISVMGGLGLANNYTNATLNLSNTTLFRLGGNYTVRMRGWDSFYQQNTTDYITWFGLVGNANVTEM